MLVYSKLDFVVVSIRSGSGSSWHGATSPSLAGGLAFVVSRTLNVSVWVILNPDSIQDRVYWDVRTSTSKSWRPGSSFSDTKKQSKQKTLV